MGEIAKKRQEMLGEAWLGKKLENEQNARRQKSMAGIGHDEEPPEIRLFPGWRVK